MSLRIGPNGQFGDHQYHFGGGGKTKSTTTTTTDIDTTQVGIESVGDGVGIAATGDVDFKQNVTLTDQGAIGDAFEFAGEFGEDAFGFASGIAKQAGETSRRAVDVSRAAAATAVTGGASDLANINAKTIGFIVAGLVTAVAVFQLFRS